LLFVVVVSNAAERDKNNHCYLYLISKQPCKLS